MSGAILSGVVPGRRLFKVVTMMKQLDVESYLLFYCLVQSGNYCSAPSVEDYMRTNGREVKAACKVAEWLGFAVRDKNTLLGYKPTQKMVDQILQREKVWNFAKRTKAPKPWELDAFSMIFEAATRDSDDQLDDGDQYYVQWFLGFIGLMKITEDGEWYPTPGLLDLAAECRERGKLAKSAPGQ
jgi:hypothetical protein